MVSEPQPDETIIEGLQRLVDEARQLTDREALAEPVAVDAPLAAVIDSMSLATLIVLVEEEWGIEFADEEIDPEHFATVGALAALLTRR